MVVGVRYALESPLFLPSNRVDEQCELSAELGHVVMPENSFDDRKRLSEGGWGRGTAEGGVLRSLWSQLEV